MNALSAPISRIIKLNLNPIASSSPLQPRRLLSSTAASRLNNTNPNPHPSSNPGQLPSPKFSLKQLGATPRARAAVYLGILVMGVAESAAYYNFTPKVLGWERKDVGRG